MKVSVRRRFTDAPQEYNVYSQLRRGGVLVRCPKCGGAAVLRLRGEDYRLTCEICRFSETRVPMKPVVAAQNACIACGRWFNLRLPEQLAPYPLAKVACPYCRIEQTAPVRRIGFSGADVLDGLELYFKGAYRGHVVWALNREHLGYLIDYISAGLREKHLSTNGAGDWYVLQSGQAQRLPGWMKKAKNRDGLLKLLKKMRELP